eukprot:tig00000821_g4493.t1
MSNEQMKEFGRLASSGNVREGQRDVRPSLVDPVEGSRFHMTSEFSRFGIGAKSAIFFFGPLLKLTSKVEDSLTVYRLNMDLREIQQRRQHVARFEQALANADELEVGSFTHIEISEVNAGVPDYWRAHKTAIIRFLAETYHFYLHGGFKEDPERLQHLPLPDPEQPLQQPMQLPEALCPVKLIVVEYDGKQELTRLVLPYALSQLEHPPPAISSEVKASIENEVRALHRCLHPPPGAATAAGDDWPRQGDPRLRWEKTYTVQYVDEKTSSRRSVEVTIVLKYFPVLKNRETSTVRETGLGDREGPKATLTNNKKWLAWMDKPGRRSRELPFECWPRVRGFLFLSSEFEPQSHKTQMAVNPAAFKALIADEYEELRREFRARVKEWHKFDDEVSCPERFSGDFKEPRTKKVIGRTLDFVKLGKTTYKPGHRVKVRYEREKVSGAASILVGTIKAIYVEGAPASQEGPEPSDFPCLSFEQMSLPEHYGEARLLKIAATDLVGMPSVRPLARPRRPEPRCRAMATRGDGDAGPGVTRHAPGAAVEAEAAAEERATEEEAAEERAAKAKLPRPTLAGADRRAGEGKRLQAADTAGAEEAPGRKAVKRATVAAPSPAQASPGETWECASSAPGLLRFEPPWVPPLPEWPPSSPPLGQPHAQHRLQLFPPLPFGQQPPYPPPLEQHHDQLYPPPPLWQQQPYPPPPLEQYQPYSPVPPVPPAPPALPSVQVPPAPPSGTAPQPCKGSKKVTLDCIRWFFEAGWKQKDAALHLELDPKTLKKACSRLGVDRWPVVSEGSRGFRQALSKSPFVPSRQ